MTANHYLAIDPGHTSGWATFNNEGGVTGAGQIKGMPEMHAFLSKLTPPPKVVIIENFRLFAHKAAQQSGSSLETVQVIGLIKSMCYGWQAEVVEQAPSIKPIAEKWSGIKPKGSHDKSHKVDAYNHGIYYLVQNKIVDIMSLLEGIDVDD